MNALGNWIRGGRLGFESVFLGLGPFELWAGWLSRAPMSFGFSVLPGSDPVGEHFDYIADLKVGRLRVTLIWLGPRPMFWEH